MCCNRATIPSRWLLTGLAFGAAGFAIYGFAPTGAWFLIGLPVSALSALSAPAAQALVTGQVDPHEQGRVQGALTGLVSLAGIIGPPTYSYVFALFISRHAPAHLPGAPWLLASLLLLCAWLAGWGYATHRTIENRLNPRHGIVAAAMQLARLHARQDNERIAGSEGPPARTRKTAHDHAFRFARRDPQPLRPCDTDDVLHRGRRSTARWWNWWRRSTPRCWPPTRPARAAGRGRRTGPHQSGTPRRDPLGTARELATMRRLFAVMGMAPVGYYDLSVAGVPVHSTAFRPVDEAALSRNPFRVFTRCCGWS